MKWWQLVQQFTKLLNEQASTMNLVWFSLYPETRVHLLQSVNAGELYANSIEKLKNIDWIELYPETKDNLFKLVFG
jgi:fumarate reductase subunit C